MVRPLSQEDAQKDVGEAKYNPFADLKAMMKEEVIKNAGYEIRHSHN